MRISPRRFVLWAVLLLGLLGIGKQVELVWPVDNRLIVSLPDAEVRAVTIELCEPTGEALRSVTLFPRASTARQVEHSVKIARGDYQATLVFEYRSAAQVDKNHGGGWTRVGVQHQIRLTGEDYRFPAPQEAQ
jgi:hypothetical protein